MQGVFTHRVRAKVHRSDILVPTYAPSQRPHGPISLDALDSMLPELKPAPSTDSIQGIRLQLSVIKPHPPQRLIFAVENAEPTLFTYRPI